jgi:tetratricopeptide (TPR) repeat protein
VESRAPRRPVRALVFVLALSALCTLHKLGNAAVWDDVQILAQAADVHAHGGAWRAFTGSTLDALLGDDESRAAQSLDLFRPLSLWSFLAGYALGGAHPPVHHLMNTLLHVLCVWLVYRLAARLVPDEPRVALLSAACFGLTPVLTEAHVWISGRFDLLSTCLGLCALLSWRRSQDAAGSQRRLLQFGAALCWLAGLLSKEPLLFALPAVVAWPGPRIGLRARLRASTPLWLASALYLGWRSFALAHTSIAGTSGARPLTAAAHLPALLLDGALHVLVPLDIYPRALNEDYAALGGVGLLGCALLLCAACALTWRARRAHPVLAWSWLWFVCTLAPVALVTTRMWPGFGRFLYLPASLGLVGVIEFASAAVQRARPRMQRVLLAATFAYLALLCVRSHVVVYDWANDETLFSSIIRAAPQRSHGYGFLGMTYLEQKRYVEAARVLERAVAIAPGEPRWPSHLGQALLFTGQRDAALALAERYIARFGYAPEYHLLAAYSLLDRDPDRAAQHVLACLTQDPEHAQCRDALAFLWSRHPQAARYRESFRALLAQSRYAALRPLAPR